MTQQLFETMQIQIDTLAEQNQLMQRQLDLMKQNEEDRNQQLLKLTQTMGDRYRMLSQQITTELNEAPLIVRKELDRFTEKLTAVLEGDGENKTAEQIAKLIKVLESHKNVTAEQVLVQSSTTGTIQGQMKTIEFMLESLEEKGLLERPKKATPKGKVQVVPPDSQQPSSTTENDDNSPPAA